MAGVPKKMAALRQGNGGTRDVVLRDEQPPVPLPPRGLLRRSKQRWVAYWESPVARAADPVADLHRVERWIRSVDEYERVYPVFVKERTAEGSQGQPVLNPLASYLKSLEGEIAKAETELGMTPMSRLRLGIAWGQAKLTAQQINQALRGDDGRRDDDAAYDDWAEA